MLNNKSLAFYGLSSTPFLAGIMLLLSLILPGCDQSNPVDPLGGDLTGQGGEGTVEGYVTDPFDSPFSFTSVALYNNEGIIAQSRTDAEGLFSFSNVPFGPYQIQVTREGFKKTNAVGLVGALQKNAFVSVQLKALSDPSGGVLGSRVLSYTPNSMSIEVDVFVVNEDAEIFDNLAPSDFTIEGDNTTNSGFTDFAFSQDGVVFLPSPNLGSYSAAMLFDQSGSISSTDPNDARIQASKIFLNALGRGDNVILSAFTTGSQLPASPLAIYGNQFTEDGPSYFPTIDTFADLEGGGTPLLISLNEMINFTAQNAPNENKAVIVFTDGADTEGGVTIDQIAENATNTGVRVFPIGLSTSVDLQVLGQIATRTNGSLMFASDARQLVSLYGTLSNILRGSTSFYRTSWNVTSSRDVIQPGFGLGTTLEIDTPEGIVEVALYVEIPVTGGKGGGKPEVSVKWVKPAAAINHEQ